MTTLVFTLAICHLLLLAPLAILGLHKAWMMLLWRQRREPDPAVRSQPTDDLPRVTVQLPVYNERFVVGGLLDAVTTLEYPRDRLQIQVLDDSTDDTPAIVAAKLRQLPADIEVQHIRRTDRSGYKAGALENGLHEASGELVAVFDADFLPRADFLLRTVPRFANPRVGCVQARWEHTNRRDSTLTRVQALLLDGHFAIEQPARSRNGCFFNFNGTAGIFRRECIEDAGGWQHDTLTEDMDLSYRAQLRGWQFVYLEDLSCPAELPVDMNGFLTQQHRWAKGSIQTGRKLLGRIWRAPLPLLAKVESVFHLYGNVAFPLLLALILVAMPLQLLRFVTGTPISATLAYIEGMPLILATLSVFFYYGLSQAVLGRLRPTTLLRLPLVLALGAGASLNNTLAVCAAMRREPGEFRRTPKHCSDGVAPRRYRLSYHSPRGLLPLFELLLSAWALTTCCLAAAQAQWSAAMFHALFATGLLWVGLRSLGANRRYYAVLPVAALAGCSGGGGTTVPIIVRDQEPEIVACQARIEKEHSLTEIVHATRQGLGIDDLPSRAGMELDVRVHPDGKRIVFVRERKSGDESSREIYTAALEGSVPELRLTGNSHLDDSPCWSPDGKQILFSSQPGANRTLWRMDADGGNLAQVTSGAVDDRDPDWHENGVLYTHTDLSVAPAHPRIYRMQASGANPVALTNGPPMGDGEAAWAPDGKSILFIRRLGIARTVLVHLDLSSMQEQELSDRQGQDRLPRWSPHGDRIYLTRSRPAAGLAGLRLYALEADGDNPLLVFPDQRFAYPGFDPTPAMRVYVAPDPKVINVDVGKGVISKRLGIVSRGIADHVLKKDGVVLGMATQLFDRREVAGILLKLELPVEKPEQIAALEIVVTAAVTRTDKDSFLRLALHNALAQRFDSVLEIAPMNADLRTYRFATASLAHVDRYGQIRLEVIGDLSAGAQAELLVDHIGVAFRQHAEQ